MTDGVPLRCLSVKGFTSLSDATLDITSAITLLVGANGAGKSNIVDAFEILGRIVDGQLNEHLVRRGGLAALLYRSPEPALAPDSIELQVTGERIDGECDWYRAVISTAAEDQAVLEEFVHDHDQAEPERPLGVASESQLRSAARTMPAAKRILEVIANCRVFHFDDTSPDAPPKKRTDVADSLMHPAGCRKHLCTPASPEGCRRRQISADRALRTHRCAVL